MIEFQGVHKIYDSGVQALKDVNIKIDKGEFVFIVGESGAGKSTFLKLIMREELPTAGEVLVNNYKLSKVKKKEVPYLRRTMGIVFQDFRLINNMNVFDNVAFAMRVVGASNRQVHKRVPYVLSLVNLEGKMRSFPLELSGGEQQRVGLARALINNPSMIVADEPTGNVDPEMSFEIMELLTRINRLGTTVIVVTHAHDLVEKFNHRVIKISDGTVVSDSGQKVKPVEEAPIPNVSSVEELAYKEEYTDYEEYDNYEPAEPEVPAEESTPAMASDVQAILDGVLTEQPDETAGKGGAEE
ncbi:MAG: cell division ATP-binding protein FtsE [Clostridia bacterium]|nr:cell division ATP-binding protein FtsE [Clostridia bacterium]